LHWGPDWSAATPNELRARVEAALDDSRGWVVDGNYDSQLGGLLLERAELVVWLDLPLSTKLMRLARRTARRILHDEPLWHENRENLKAAFWGGESLFVWAVRSHLRHKRDWPARLARVPHVRLRTPEAVRVWLASAAPVF
jgi:hypothetical protein